MDNKRSHNIEILAPVGSRESLAAALQAGADSVYFGIENLNMRFRSSNNFSIADLPEIIEKCHKKAVKTYITLNTIMYDNDLDLMRDIIDAAAKHQVDAIIASDQAVINYAFQKHIPLHLSTQLNISNFETVRFYAPYADVMVLARELSLEKIKYISTAIEKNNICGPSGKPVQIELFAHGALCMAVSGKCYLSEHLHGASANRGACYQVCRRTYTVKDENGNEMILDNPYILSPKDLCTVDFIDKIIDAGVNVLKIEGRGRSPEYVKKTVETYKKAVQYYANGKYNISLGLKLKSDLEKVFHRGFWEGHYLGENISQWNTNVHGSKTKIKKMYVAKGIKYFKNIKVGEFLMENGTLHVGDRIMIIGPTTGVLELSVNDLYFEEKHAESVSKGDSFSIQIDEVIRPSDKVYILKEEK